jgi:hypothetical protein
MHGCDRIDVVKNQHIGVLVHFFARDLATHDLAK